MPLLRAHWANALNAWTAYGRSCLRAVARNHPSPWPVAKANCPEEGLATFFNLNNPRPLRERFVRSRLERTDPLYIKALEMYEVLSATQATSERCVKNNPIYQEQSPNR